MKFKKSQGVVKIQDDASGGAPVLILIKAFLGLEQLGAHPGLQRF